VSAPRRAALAAAMALALGSTGCCRILTAILEEGVEREPSPTGPALELGLAAYPAGTPARATDHTWLDRYLRPDVYRLGYALAPAEAAAVDGDLQAWSRKVGYESESKDRFRWRPPAGCEQGFACVYQSIAARSLADVEPIVARFRARGRDAKLSTWDLTELVVTFVQAIPYEIPEQEPFGVLPPALVASRRKGDCDSKALLAHMILHGLGVDTMMVGSSAHHHEMLGIALPAQGTKFTYAGRDYAFTEMTAKGSPIGHINPQLLAPNDWKPVPFAFPKPTSTPTATPSPTDTSTPKKPRKR
jgi:hypothetical protein